MLVGQPPFYANTPAETQWKVGQKCPPPNTPNTPNTPQHHPLEEKRHFYPYPSPLTFNTYTVLLLLDSFHPLCSLCLSQHASFNICYHCELPVALFLSCDEWFGHHFMTDFFFLFELSLKWFYEM